MDAIYEERGSDWSWQVDGRSVTRPFLSLRRMWLARQTPTNPFMAIQRSKFKVHRTPPPSCLSRNQTLGLLPRLPPCHGGEKNTNLQPQEIGRGTLMKGLQSVANTLSVHNSTIKPPYQSLSSSAAVADTLVCIVRGCPGDFFMNLPWFMRVLYKLFFPGGGGM